MFLRYDMPLASAREADSEGFNNMLATTLVALDRFVQRLCCRSCVPTKSPSYNYAEKVITYFLECMGHKEAQLLTDGEPGIVWLARKIRERALKSGVRVDCRVSPRYSSASLGAVGKAQHGIQRQVRALKTDIHLRSSLWILPDCTAWPWMVRHAAWLLDRFALQTNRSSAFDNACGVRFRGPILRFGEFCWFRHPTSASGRMAHNRRAAKADNAWEHGVWLGRAHSSNEQLIGTSAGIVFSRSVKRCPPAVANRSDELLRMQGVPWDPQSGAPVGRPRAQPRPVAEAVAIPPRTLMRRFQIKVL